MPRLSPLVALLALLALAVPATASAARTGSDSGAAIVVIDGDVTVDRGEAVDGVFIAHGDARIAGHVEGDVMIFSGDALVSGSIDGNLVTVDGSARLLPSAIVGGDVSYSSERPTVSDDARVGGDVTKEDWPDSIDVFPVFGALVFWLAVGLSSFVLGALLLLIAPRAADAIAAQTRGRVGPTIAIGIAILITLPIAAFVAAITVVGLPLALGISLAFLPLAAVAYVVAAWALGRLILKPPRERLLSFLVGLAILHVATLVPFLGVLVGLAALVYGLGLIGAAIGAARKPVDSPPVQSPGI